jgi:hypothetical protein
MTINELIAELYEMDGESEAYVMLPNQTGVFHFTSVEMTAMLETDEGVTIFCIVPHEPEQTPFLLNYN